VRGVRAVVAVASVLAVLSQASSATAAGPGLLRVTTSPAVASQVTVDGNIADSWGLDWLKLAPGSHVVCFTAREGYTTPPCQTVTVISGMTTPVNGAFVQRGFLHVFTAPAVPSTISVDGIAMDDWGVYTDLPAGSHMVCFGLVKDFTSPGCQPATVTAGSTTLITGAFTASPGSSGQTNVGLLRVVTVPAVASQISVDGNIADTWGLNWLEIAPGSHTVCFSAREGYTTPPCQTVTITDAMTTPVTGTFVQRGFLHVFTSPASPSTISVDGIPMDDWGVFTDLPIGPHTVCFGPAPGYATAPPCQPVTLTAGHVSDVTGTFISGGTGISWGYNQDGELGNGTTSGSAFPVPVSLPSGTTITAVAGGNGHGLALTSNGSVLAWGYNAYGELGNGTTVTSLVPVSVGGLLSGKIVTAIAAGDSHSLALTSTGSVYAWGYNLEGELGNGTTSNSAVPVRVSLQSGTTVTAIAAGSAHSLAVTSTGSVLAWGSNGALQLGQPNATTFSAVPVPVSIPSGVTITAVAGGEFHSLAVTSTGSVLAWGSNTFGELGDGTTTESYLPVSVSLPSGNKVTAVAAGTFFSLALTSTGSVLGWGFNSAGQLGDGTGSNSPLPVSVALPSGAIITALAARSNHSLAVTSTGSALAWGYNSDGQLGDGTFSTRLAPVAVALASGTSATAVAAGPNFSLAVIG
jgi:alpha-tubulin suppressor-like RCC1 family protein